MGKKKIAIINQRYGTEVNGGSEYYTRMLAERLCRYYEVEVLTTCAEEYQTWENCYACGIEKINGVTVRRFPVAKVRNLNWFRVLSKMIRILPVEFEWLERIWVKEQGPYAPELLDYMEERQEEYDRFLFVTYLYYLTWKGLPKVAWKSILIPTAHQEPYIYFLIYRKIFTSPKAIIYLTEEEKKFVHQIFQNQNIPSQVIGMGIEVPKQIDPESFRKKYQIQGEYLLYIGRIDQGKNCRQMFEYFIRYKKEQDNRKELKLVLAGKAAMAIPEHADIIFAGYLSEQEKYNAIGGAKALWMPSEYESLSIAVLEAMALGTAILVNGVCEVLKGHCVRCNIPGIYSDYASFRKEVEYQLQTEHTDRKKQEAKREIEYIKANYSWNRLLFQYRQIIEMRDEKD